LIVTAVVADAEYGDNAIFRATLHRARLPYAVGMSPTLTVFRGTPRLRVDRRQLPPRNRRGGWPDQASVSVRALSDALPAQAWRGVS
jgi:SRSO17 transposase